MGRTGKSLRSAVNAYNQAVGSLEHNVLPQARRFHELGVIGDAEKGGLDLEQVDAVARHVQAPELSGTSPALELLERPGVEDADEATGGLPGAARG
jgi:DNA anti-recombination protein RmuC